MMASFPILMAQDRIGNNEKLVSCLIVYSKIGILDVFMCSNDGCNFAKNAIDKLHGLGLVEDFESAIAFYSTIESPVECPSQMDYGYFVVEDETGFFVQDHQNNRVAKIKDLNDLILGKVPDFDNEDEVLGLFETAEISPKEMLDRLFKKKETKMVDDFDDSDFDIEDDNANTDEDSDEDSDDFEWV